MNGHRHQRRIALAMKRVLATRGHMSVRGTRAATLLLVKERVDLRKVRGESPRLEKMLGLFTFLDGFQAEFASIKIGSRHMEGFQKRTDTFVPPIFAFARPLHYGREPSNFGLQLDEAIDQRIEEFPVNLKALTALGFLGVD